MKMGCEDLGHHYHAIGDLSAAMKAYSKEREVVQSPAHMLVMHQHLMHVAIDQNNWISVQTTAERLRNIPQRPEVVPQIQHKVQSAIGLAQLATGQYRDAAMSFLETDPTMIQPNQDVSRDYYADNEVLSANDIAIYAGLCALATMNRDELQKHVLNNTDFRNYLELEPHIRRAISFFVASKYSACLAILEAYKTDYLLDYYLHRHLEKIYFNVRSHAIIQYFVPFSCVTLQALAAAFNTDEPTIERTLANMIRDGTLDARIDLGDRVLLRRQVDQRKAVHQEALEMAKDYERSLQLRILRMEIINAGLEVPLETDKSMGIGNILNQTGSNLGSSVYTGPESKGKGKGLRGFFGQ
jgi:COP9 signalosome complex subunit 1